ncbi:carboxylating nicotinate-nucleotide diphosphorylase [bacterium]|nr:carboxylating nicotinate-nucleotide diphosphorylase [bacterium]
MERFILDLIEQALVEDIRNGDITTLYTVPKNKNGKGEFLIKENGIIAGLDIVKKVFELVDHRIKVNFNVKDSDNVKNKQIIGTISGPLRGILTGERVALNFLQRISGIATLTREYVDIVKKHKKKIKILDTRKTTPNFRFFEKYAVKLGGGYNHRMGLYDAAMIKDNHIIAAGGIEKALADIGKKLGHTVTVEVEVKSISQIKEVLKSNYKPNIIMLDNFKPNNIKKAVNILKGHNILMEVSGNISLENIHDYLIAGVDVISIGKLTHSYKSLDISLNLNL